MNEKEIQSFSLETLLTVNEPRPEDLYFDGCLIASRVKIMDTVNIDLFRYPTRLDAFAILFCSEGSISFTSGLRRHTLDAKMLFVFLPGSILQVESIRPESSVYTVICEEEFIRRINIDIKLLSRLFLSVEKQPCLRLCEAEWAGITGSFAEIRSESLPRPGDVYSPEILRSMIRTLAYKVCRIIGRHIESQPAPETSGRTAAEWIDDYVVLEAKNLLKYSTMSIQEIAYCLNFPNQSFFGKYFRSHTGMTPSAYRMSK